MYVASFDIESPNSFGAHPAQEYRVTLEDDVLPPIVLYPKVLRNGVSMASPPFTCALIKHGTVRSQSVESAVFPLATLRSDQQRNYQSAEVR